MSEPLNVLISRMTAKEADLDIALEANDIVAADNLNKELAALEKQVKAHNDNASKLAEIKASKSARAEFLAKPVHKYPLPGGGGNGVSFDNRIDTVETELDRQKSAGHFLQMVGYTGMLDNNQAREYGATVLANLYDAPRLKDFDERYEKNMKGMGVTKAALSESAGVTGGYTAPPEYSKTLFALSVEDSVIAGKTDDYTLSGRELVLPTLDQTQTLSAGQTNLLGGIIATWTAEAATRTETEPKFRDLRLVSNELAGYALASRNLIQDNVVALEQRLTKLFASAVGWYRDYAYLQGNGVDKPQGMLNSPAAVSVTRGTSSKITYVDLAKMYGALLPQSQKRAFWVMQQSAIQSMLQMVDTAGNLIIQPYYPGGAQGGPASYRPMMLMLGMPVITTEKLPALGTKGDLLLVDPTLYATGTRQEIEIGASEHFKFTTNQMTYRFIFRGDGRSWFNAPITLQDQSTTVSPIVILN